jgi:CubicO group peptidase (beta-lactamase class C family)
VNRADSILDGVVAEIRRTGFTAHGVHVLAGDDTAGHLFTADVRRDIQSIAKGVCVIAAGIAADEGMLSLDAPVATYLPGVALGAGVDEVTLRHLLTMSSGIELPWSATMMSDWPDLAVEFLGRPSRGRVFQYSNASTYTAMRALAAVVGDVVSWLGPRLFAPLGIDDVVWQRCPNGYIVAGGGLALRTDELARVGRLIRDRGVWEGCRIVGAEWIDGMHAGWVVAGPNPGYDRYALAGWGGPGSGWRLHGAHGQLLIFDDAGLGVVTITAAADRPENHTEADALAAVAMVALEGTAAASGRS